MRGSAQSSPGPPGLLIRSGSNLIWCYCNFLQNPDQGFDPEDPAVKGIEDWDCSNNMDTVDSSLDNLVRPTDSISVSCFVSFSIFHQFLVILVFKHVFLQRTKSRKLKHNVFKRLSKAEERKSLLEGEVKEEKQEEEEPGCGCFTNWLIYIFIRIFD